MSLAKQIEQLQEKKAASLEKMQGMITKSEENDVTFTDEEQGQFDALEKECEEFEQRIQNLEKAEKRQMSAPAVRVNMHSQGKGKEREKGVFFARMAHALYVNDGNRQAAADYVKSKFDDREVETVLRAPQSVFQKSETVAADTSVAAWAGALTIVNEASSEFIELLRPMSVMARTPARRMNFDGANQIKIPRMTAGIGGGYIGENKAIPVKQGAFDNLLLSPKKIAVITASSTENLERSSPALETLLRDDMLASTATVVDAKFISTDAGTAVAPAGILTYGTAVTASADPSGIVNIAADLRKLWFALKSEDCPMTNPVIYMNSKEHTSLLFAQDANSNYIYRDEVSGGTLFGAAIVVSNSVAEGTVVMADANSIIIAEDMAPMLDISEDAAVHMDTAPEDDLAAVTPGVGVGEVRSLWQSDQVGIRLRWRHDWSVRNGVCVAYLTGADWDAGAAITVASIQAETAGVQKTSTKKK